MIAPLLQLVVMIHGIFSGRDTLYGFLEYLTLLNNIICIIFTVLLPNIFTRVHVWYQFFRVWFMYLGLDVESSCE